MDKSSTHVKVQKNGIEDLLPKTTWQAIGGQDNKDGWVLIQTAPPEAVLIKQKKEAKAEDVPGVTEVPQASEQVISIKEKAKKAK